MIERGNLDRVLWQPVTQQIAEADLDVYRRAGEVSGFGIEVIARPGESFTGFSHLIVVDSGRVGIKITKPDGEQDHAPFWRALQQLRDLTKGSESR